MKLTALPFLHTYCYFFPSIFTLRLQRSDCTIQAAQMAAEGLYLPGVCITAEPMYTAEHSSLSDIDVQHHFPESALHNLWKYLWEILECTQVYNTLAGRNQRKSCSEFIMNAQKKVLPAFSAVDAKDGLKDVKHWESVDSI